ncbi:unnamed protein product [Closterium sp. NIES-53]
MTTLRVLLHVAAQHDSELHSLDFSTAFLQGSLHEKIWLRCPPGFTGTYTPRTQWQLCRAVYGRRQVPREWHDTLRTTLAALDFFPSSADPSLFVRRGSTLFFVLVYVDDLVFSTPIPRALILTRFGFPFSKVQPTPLAVDHGLTAPPSDEPFEYSDPYPELAAKRVAKYVASTSGMGLVLGGKQPVTLTGFSDSSWADDAESLQSIEGYCFSLGTGAVLWRSTQASSISSSSCEAEVYAAAMTAQELCWLSFLLTNLGEQPRSPLS